MTMVVDLPRRWQWAIGGGCALVLALLVGFVVVGLGVIPVAELAQTGIDSAPPMALAPAARVEPPARGAFARAPRPIAIEARGPDEVQVCGGAWVRARPDGSLDSREVMRAAAPPAARERVLAALRNDPGELAHAAALLLTAREPAPPCETAECAAARGTAIDADAGRDALARMALSSSDARVYALAFQRCAGQRSEGSCQMLSAEQWARLDSGNASPWLYILASAKARNDRAANDEALHRIASSQRSDVGFFDVPGLVANAAPADEASMAAAWVLAHEALGSAAARGLPAYQHLTAACRGDLLRDGNRRQTCNAIAELMNEGLFIIGKFFKKLEDRFNLFYRRNDEVADPDSGRS